MHWTEFVLGLAKALAWPLTIYFVALIFRRELRQIMRRLNRVKYGDWEAYFERELERAEESASGLVILDNHDLAATKPADYHRIMSLVEISPDAAIMEAWKEIELSLAKAVQAAGIDIKHKFSGVPEVSELVRRGLLPKDMLLLYSNLKHLRNRAAHAPSFELDRSAAVRYIELASKLVAKVDELSTRDSIFR